MMEGQHMDYTQLVYFVTAVEEKNVTRAAEILNITQPALSKALSRLEAELGTKLFIKAGRGNTTSSTGDMFYRFAKRALTELDSIKKDIAQAGVDSMNKISIAISGTNFTAPIVSGFHREFPDIRIKEVSFTRVNFPAIIYDHDIDCVLSTKGYTASKVNQMLISSSPLFAVVPPNHIFADRKSVSLMELKNEVFLMPSSQSLFYDELLDVFNSAGFAPKIGVEAERSHIAEMVLDGMGITICSNTAPYKKQSVCPVIQLEDDFCRRCTYLIWQERDNRASVVQAFIDFVSDLKQEMKI